MLSPAKGGGGQRRSRGRAGIPGPQAHAPTARAGTNRLKIKYQSKEDPRGQGKGARHAAPGSAARENRSRSVCLLPGTSDDLN